MFLVKSKRNPVQDKIKEKRKQKKGKKCVRRKSLVGFRNSNCIVRLSFSSLTSLSDRRMATQSYIFTSSQLSKPFRKKYMWVSAHLTYTRMFPHICKLIQGRLDWTCLDYSFFLAFIFAMRVKYHEWLSLGHLLYFVTIHRFELGHCYLKTSPWPGKIMVGQFSPPNKGGEQTKPTEVLPICQPRTLHILDAW